MSLFAYQLRAERQTERRRREQKLAQAARPGTPMHYHPGSAGGATDLSHTYVQNVVHITFSTSERRKLIAQPMRERLWSYCAGICKAEKIYVHGIGGIEDHIHLLVQLPPTMTLANAVMKIKAIRHAG